MEGLEPDVRFSLNDVQRMVICIGQLYTVDPVVNSIQMPDYSELFGEIVYLSDGEESDNSEDIEKEYTAAEYYQTLPRRNPWKEIIGDTGEGDDHCMNELICTGVCMLDGVEVFLGLVGACGFGACGFGFGACGFGLA